MGSAVGPSRVGSKRGICEEVGVACQRTTGIVRGYKFLEGEEGRRTADNVSGDLRNGIESAQCMMP